jgi:ribonuclease P protein component
VVHLAPGIPATVAQPNPDEPLTARAGFVVSRAVGGAVVRNAVTRRLRALVRERIDQLPAGSLLVVRALPSAGVATFAELGAQLDSCLARLLPAASAEVSP